MCGLVCSVRRPSKASLAFIVLFLLMWVAWSSILIGRLISLEICSPVDCSPAGLVFTFRVNRHDCEMCSTTTLCRSVWQYPALLTCTARYN